MHHRARRPAELRREVMENDFLEDEFKQFHFPVAGNEPFERLRKLIELLRRQMPECAQREVHHRQMRVRGGLGNVGEQRGGFLCDCRVQPRGEAGKLRRADSVVIAQQHRINQGDGIERLARGGLHVVGQRLAQLLGVTQMQRRGIAEVWQNGVRPDDRRRARPARGENCATQNRAKKIWHLRALWF